MSNGGRNCIQDSQCTYANLLFNLHDNKYLYSFEEVVLLVLYGAITSSLRTLEAIATLFKTLEFIKNVVFLVIYAHPIYFLQILIDF